MERSVVRRALLLMGFVLPGHVLNYALLVGGTHLLGTVAFGIFYASISIINVLIAPSVILGLFIARHLVQIRAKVGTNAAIDDFRMLFRATARWGAVGAMLGLVSLGLIGSLVGVESVVLIVLIVGTTYAIYLADVVRAGFQGLQWVVLLGVTGFAWMSARFALGMLGFAIVGTPWAGLAGVLVSGVATCALFHYVIVRAHVPDAAAAASKSPVRVRKLAEFSASYGLFAVVMYADVLLGYLLLDRGSLGIYAASSVLPKAIIVLSMPVGQVLFPVLTSEESVGRVSPASVAKGLGLTLCLSGTAASTLLLLSHLFCAGTFAIKLCEPNLMTVLALSAVPICLLRVFVMIQLARGRDLHPLLLALPLAAWVAYLSGLDAYDVHEFARVYVAFAWAALGFYVLACVLPVRRPRAVAAP
jgi:hypothetical protein